ncbi:MAG: alpha/beta fold hydrolase [Candidatus Nanopelagicus sp.]
MKLSMETYGQGEAIVLIHGMGSAATAWKPILSELTKQFEVVTVDLPGHGRTPYSPIQQMDPTSLANLVTRNLKEIGKEKFHLVGNSLGGWISLEIAAITPEAVRTVTALAPAGLWLTPFTSRYPGELALRAMASGVEKLAPSLLNYTWAKRIGFETVSPRWKDLSYEICLDATNAMASSTGYFPAWDALLGKRFDKQIDRQIPITIVFGDSDHTLPAKTCQERSLAPSHAKWVVLPDTGHAPMWDSPTEVLAEITQTALLKR